MKAVDARLKEAGIKSIGQRLKIQTAVQKAADSSNSVPAPPAPPAPPKPPPASEVVEQIVADGHDLEALLSRAGSGPDRSALAAELKRLGYKTGARLRLEQALQAIAAERNREENAKIIREAKEAAVRAYEDEQRVERAARQAEAAQRAQEVEEAARAERAKLFERYEREMMSEVDKLKLARKQVNAARRAEQQTTKEAHAFDGGGGPSAGRAAQPFLVDASDGDGGVQGLSCHDAAMAHDDDGDVAHGFLLVLDNGGCSTATVVAEEGDQGEGGGGNAEALAAAWLARHAEEHSDGMTAELNQYWYSAHTIATLCDAVRECRHHHYQQMARAPSAGGLLECAFLSTPSLFFSLSPDERTHCRVLDYDTSLGEDVIFYDFNAPTEVPAELRGAFSCVVIDPPYITPEAWRKYAQTARLLLPPEGGRVIGTTIVENASLLRELLDVRPNRFLPSIPQLPYQYAAYTNFESAALVARNHEVPADPEEVLAIATTSTVEEVRAAEGEKPIRKQTKTFEELLAEAEASGQMF